MEVAGDDEFSAHFGENLAVGTGRKEVIFPSSTPLERKLCADATRWQ